MQNATRRAQEMQFEYKNVISFRGLRSPGPLTRGCAPGLRWGLRPQTSVIHSRSALAMVPSKLNSSLCSTKFFLKYMYVLMLTSSNVHSYLLI